MFEGFLLVIFLIVIVALMNKKNLDARAPIPLDGAHHRCNRFIYQLGSFRFPFDASTPPYKGNLRVLERSQIDSRGDDFF